MQLSLKASLGLDRVGGGGGGGFGDFSQVKDSKIQLNYLWYRLRVAGSQQHIPTQGVSPNSYLDFQRHDID